MAIQHDALARFVRCAIESAAARGEGAGLGIHLRNIRIDDNHDVRANLDDGSSVVLQIEHIVPRGYFGTPRDDGTAVDPDGEPGA